MAPPSRLVELKVGFKNSCLVQIVHRDFGFPTRLTMFAFTEQHQTACWQNDHVGVLSQVASCRRQDGCCGSLSPEPFAALQEANRETACKVVLAHSSTESDGLKGGDGGTLVGEMLRCLFLFCLNPAVLAIARSNPSCFLPANLESRNPKLFGSPVSPPANLTTAFA